MFTFFYDWDLMKPRRKNPEERKTEILNTFYLLVIEEGFEGVSIGKIAKRMGINPSLIMHYFSTKDQMTVAMVDHAIEEYTSLVRNIRMDASDPYKRFHRLIEILWSDEWYEMTNISADFSFLSISFRNEAINARLKHLYSGFKRYLVREINGFVDAGVILCSNPVRAVEIIMTLIEGYRHFQHFITDDDAVDAYRLEMKRLTLSILESQTWSDER